MMATTTEGGRPKITRRWLIGGFALLCAAALVSALIVAPYLPRLVFEGYPPATWPARGVDPDGYATVDGTPGTVEIPADGAGASLNAASRTLFEASGGRALLVHQGGRLQLEHYGEGFGPDSRLNSYSMVKSLIGALVLRAHAEGRIASLNDPIGSYLATLGDRGFQAIPVLDFLQMRSGVVFEHEGTSALGGGRKDIETTTSNPFGPMARLHMMGLGGVQGGLRPEPGADGQFNYQNVNTAVLGRLLASVYQMPLEEVLQTRIWQPAGAGPAQWRRHGTGLEVTAYCCLFATPRDWLRVGLFLASNGAINDANKGPSKEVDNGAGSAPFLPQSLWRRFLGRDLDDAAIRRGRYGLHIHHDVLDRQGEALQGRFSYMAGSRGQMVYLMPERDLVVVRFGGKPQLLHSTLYAAWRSMIR